jgi:hypothetical protein
VIDDIDVLGRLIIALLVSLRVVSRVHHRVVEHDDENSIISVNESFCTKVPSSLLLFAQVSGSALPLTTSITQTKIYTRSYLFSSPSREALTISPK